MRTVVYSFLLAALVMNCTVNDSVFVAKEIESLSDPAQQFTFNNADSTTITTKKNVQLTILPNTFIDADGKPIDGEVTLELKEVFDKSEMVLNGIATLSNKHSVCCTCKRDRINRMTY